MTGQITLDNLENRGTMRAAMNTMFGELFGPGTAFRAVVSLAALTAGTAVHVVPVADVGASQRVYPLGIIGNVNGATAWTDSTATLVKLQDTAGVSGIAFPKAILTGNAVLTLGSAGITIGDQILTGAGFALGTGLDLVADANFSAGSPLYLTIWGYIG